MSCSAHIRHVVKCRKVGRRGHYLNLRVPWQKASADGHGCPALQPGVGSPAGDRNPGWESTDQNVVPVQTEESGLRFVFALSFHPKRAY